MTGADVLPPAGERLQVALHGDGEAIAHLLLHFDWTGVRVLQGLAMHPMTTGQASRASGNGRTAVRNRLSRLAASGLVRCVRREGRLTYALTPRGRTLLAALRNVLNADETCTRRTWIRPSYSPPRILVSRQRTAGK